MPDNFKIKLRRCYIIVFLPLVFFSNINCKNAHGVIQLVPAETKKGFNYPYILFTPEEGMKSDQITFIIEANNTGHVSDDLDDHMEGAYQQVKNYGYIGNYLSHNLGYPLLVPVFPRGEENWKIYTHALDRDAMLQKGNSIERIDLQLLAMFEDAKTKLTEKGYNIDDKFIITGFSASATFANRFSAIHPEKVKAYAAGGLNGMLILPANEIEGQTLLYPLGIGDFNEITGHQFDSTAFRNVPQFLFMGENDDNDAANFSDAYSDSEREIIYKFMGKSMMPERWNYCTNYYKDYHSNVTIKLYKNIGHDITDEIRNDILSFIKTIIAEQNK